MRCLAPVSFLCLLLSACMVGPDYQEPYAELPDRWENGSLTAQSNAPNGKEIKWWENYRDPILSSLVTETIKTNYDLQVSFAKLCAARADLMMADANLAPEINAFGSYSLNSISNVLREIQGGTIAPAAPQGSRQFQLMILGLDTSWELDLFGRLRRGIESAQANWEAYWEDLRNTRLSLIAEVAMTYVQLRGIQQQEKVLEGSLGFWESICRLNQDLLKAGLITEIDLNQAFASRDQVKASLQPMKAQIKQAIHRLSVLTSKPPTALYALLLPPKPIPQVPAHIFAGLPSDLLKRRPDIKEAERNLAAATASIGVAEGQFFPTFSLTGVTGYQSTLWNKFLLPGSDFYFFGPTFSWPIFNFGRVRAMVNETIAVQHEAFYQYKSVLFKALADVENSLVKYKTESIRYADLIKAYLASKEVAEATVARFEAGNITFITVLQAAIVRQTYELNMVGSQMTMVLDSIGLYKALGGGWEPSGGGCQPAPSPCAGVTQRHNSSHQDKGSKASPK